MTFEQAVANIIFKDEDIIGYSWDIARYFKYEMEYQKENLTEDEMENYEDNMELYNDLLEDLDQHDGLVYVSYHPMGAYFVDNLVVEGEE